MVHGSKYSVKWEDFATSSTVIYLYCILSYKNTNDFTKVKRLLDLNLLQDLGHYFDSSKNIQLFYTQKDWVCKN